MSADISVIITVHNRKEFLLDALRSVLNQGLPRRMYEVIVVKNFRDPALDDAISELADRNLFSEQIGVGGKVYEAVRVAQGEVLSFLEDDDEFLPGKLEAVHKAFRNGADYYHNGGLLVNESGRVVQTFGQAYLIRGEPEKRKNLRSMLRSLSFYNASSISIRKRLLPLDALKKIEVAPDLFYFYSALLYGSTLIDDPLPLTKVRVHSQNSSVDLTSAERNAEKQLALLKRSVSDNLLMLELTRGSPFGPAARQQLAKNRLAIVGHPFGGLGDLHPSDLFWFLWQPIPARAQRYPFRLYPIYVARNLFSPVLPPPLKRVLQARSYFRRLGLARG